MSDKAALLEQLRIERPAPAESRAASRGWIAVTAVAAAALGAGVWFVWPRGLTVAAATAEPAPSAVAAGPPSVLDASGYVVARRQATVSAKITGKVVAVDIEEGQRVERDQIIARLDDTNARAAVAQARAQREQAAAGLAAAQVALENAAPTFERNRVQLARAVISAQSFDNAKAAFDTARTSREVAARTLAVAEAALAVAERNLEDTVVRAPFGGVVTVKAAQEGEMVSPISAGGGYTRTGVGTIVDMKSLEVEVDVSENFINRVVPGQRALTKLNAYPDWDIPAHVVAIIPTADRAKATVKVRVAFDEADARILPQMGVRVTFLASGGDAPLAAASSALVVPAAAVQADGDTGVVYVLSNGSVERRSVRLGPRLGAAQVVLSGLTSGTRVAASGLGELSDGAKVRVAP
jgi:RND family efflux transporter MFP subunit